MGNHYETEKKMTMREIYTIIAPLMIAQTKASTLQSNFEHIIQQNYFSKLSLLTLKQFSFQTIKAKLFSANLIILSADANYNELFQLSELGVATLYKLNAAK